MSKKAIEALEAARAHILDAYRIWQADDVSAVPPPLSGAGAAIAKIDAALSSSPGKDGGQEVEAVKPSIDTMREAAWELIKKNGWGATARLSLHQVTGLMAQFGMNVSRGEVGCGYPDCGCCADAACEDAIKQHADFSPRPATTKTAEQARSLYELFQYKTKHGSRQDDAFIQIVSSYLSASQPASTALVERLTKALEEITERSHKDPRGSSMVVDMRIIAEDALRAKAEAQP